MTINVGTRTAVLIPESEAARILRVHEDAIRAWCSEGVLTSGPKAGAGRRLVTMDSVLALISPAPSR